MLARPFVYRPRWIITLLVLLALNLILIPAPRARAATNYTALQAGLPDIAQGKAACATMIMMATLICACAAWRACTRQATTQCACQYDSHRGAQYHWNDSSDAGVRGH
jgi:hypothetical protein